MKWTLSAILLFCAMPGAQSAQRLDVAVFQFEDPSCGAWTRSASAKNVSVRSQYLLWFRGFVSGYNYGDQEYQVPVNKMPELDTVALFIDKSCRDNPLLPFTNAAFQLVDELRPTVP